jgi:hypothetical protein
MKSSNWPKKLARSCPWAFEFSGKPAQKWRISMPTGSGHRRLELEVTETREQQEDLARRHYDILQGYLFARLMPLAELKQLPDLT